MRAPTILAAAAFVAIGFSSPATAAPDFGLMTMSDWVEGGSWDKRLYAFGALEGISYANYAYGSDAATSALAACLTSEDVEDFYRDIYGFQESALNAARQIHVRIGEVCDPYKDSGANGPRVVSFVGESMWDRMTMREKTLYTSGIVDSFWWMSTRMSESGDRSGHELFARRADRIEKCFDEANAQDVPEAIVSGWVDFDRALPGPWWVAPTLGRICPR